MKNRAIKTESCIIDFKGELHEAVKVGARIETRCGFIAKNISKSASTFKMVKVGPNDVTCRDCKSLKQICEELKE